jgi:hypothetical protein
MNHRGRFTWSDVGCILIWLLILAFCLAVLYFAGVGLWHLAVQLFHAIHHT